MAQTKQKSKGGKAILVILLLAGAGVGAYFLYKKYKKPEDVEADVDNAVQKTLDETVKRLGFKTNSAEIKAESLEALDGLAKTMVADVDLKLAIAGHTDNIGNSQANLMLSKKRAESVADYLISKGVEKARFEAKGFGDSQPMATNETPAGRAQNRRVEMKFYA